MCVMIIYKHDCFLSNLPLDQEVGPISLLHHLVLISCNKSKVLKMPHTGTYLENNHWLMFGE